jgi:hypothetical protein
LIPMVKVIRSLNARLIACFVLMMILVSGLSFFTTNEEARNQLE